MTAPCPGQMNPARESILSGYRSPQNEHTVITRRRSFTSDKSFSTMNSPIPGSPATFVSESCVWGRPSRARRSLLIARAKDLETEMYYGAGFEAPINSAIVPTIFNKLDAQCQERTRVMNNVLNKRLDVQERCILRNRDVQQRVHAKQTVKLKEDLRKISKRLPSFSKLYRNTDMALLERQVKENPVPPSKFTATLPEERHYCFRFCEHHNPVRLARRVTDRLNKDLRGLQQFMDSNATVGEDLPETGQQVQNVIQPCNVAETLTITETETGGINPADGVVPVTVQAEMEMLPDDVAQVSTSDNENRENLVQMELTDPSGASGRRDLDSPRSV